LAVIANESTVGFTSTAELLGMHIWFCNRRRIHIVPERLIICYLEEI
jgi:hypothetical protein